MRTVLILAALVALTAASIVPSSSVKRLKSVEPSVVLQQYQILELFEAIGQINIHAKYYEVGKQYNIIAHKDKYEKGAFDKFWSLYEQGEMISSMYAFSIFNEKWREEAMALYELFYNAKDFETFYKSGAWARLHVDEGMFAYAFYIAAIHRIDTQDLVLPAFYEIYPQFYANNEIFNKMSYAKMRGLPFEQLPEYGIVEDGKNYLFYANYSSYFTYGKDEFKLAYLTEDIGWNSFYAYFHSLLPFWEKGNDIIFGLLKDRRGEVYYHFYQQLLARYYMERLSNGLGEIPRFSWFQPFKYGYRPLLSTYSYPFVQRTENYVMQNELNLDDLRFVRNYEDMFLSFLENGQVEAYNQKVDLHNSKSINFVGNFWQSNPDLYEGVERNQYHQSYEMAARRILRGISYPSHDKDYLPSALDFYQTSLRDPAFYQIYNKIIGFIIQYKQNLQPYSQDSLHFIGVKVKDVEVSKLSTFFDYYRFNASNGIFYSNEELVVPNKKSFMIAQPRLNHDPFSLKIIVKSDIEEQATVKVFLGPKYDRAGYPIGLEDNWMNFVELDWFNFNLKKGDNIIERSSEEFFNYKDDSSSISEIYKYLIESKLPVDMMDNYENLPRRLMLPRGKSAGFPLQIFVMVYPSQPLPKNLEQLKELILDDKPFGYPFDRPVSSNFFQPNMYMKEVMVYHKNEEYPWMHEMQIAH